MPSPPKKTILAAQNNADLCAAIMAAHELRTIRNNLTLFCIDDPPPFYPKVVTLKPDAASELNARISGHSGIKDSFSQLDEDALGLRVAFEASWIWSSLQVQETQWVRIENADDLSKWHQAWNGKNEPDQLIFPPQCLNDPNLIFLARMSGAHIQAGCLANLSDDVIGMSNVFSTLEDDAPLYSQALAAVSSVGKGRPVVGYEHGDDLDRACAAGFQRIGPLRVLVR